MAKTMTCKSLFPFGQVEAKIWAISLRQMALALPLGVVAGRTGSLLRSEMARRSASVPVVPGEVVSSCEIALEERLLPTSCPER